MKAAARRNTTMVASIVGPAPNHCSPNPTNAGVTATPDSFAIEMAAMVRPCSEEGIIPCVYPMIPPLSAGSSRPTAAKHTRTTTWVRVTATGTMIAAARRKRTRVRRPVGTRSMGRGATRAPTSMPAARAESMSPIRHGSTP